MRLLYAALLSLCTTIVVAQATYTYTIPTTFQSVNSFTEFSFPATPPTTGDATLTLQWLACHQSGFGGSAITVQINTSNGWVTVLYDNSNYLECIYVQEAITISGALMADAITTGGGTVQCRVDCDDSCQAGVGCSFYNDPVVSGISLEYTAHAANFTADDASVCPGSTVHFTDASINTPNAYEWILPGATPNGSTMQNPVVQYTDPGTYDVTLVVQTADGADTLVMPGYITVFVPPIADAGIDEAVCAGAEAQLQAGGGVAYQWFPAAGLNNDAIADPIATPSQTTSYTVLVTDANGCQSNDNMVLTVVPLPNVQAGAGNNIICLGDTAYIVATGAQLYQWSPNLFISGATGATQHAWPTSTFTWNISGTDAFGCGGETTVTVTVQPPPVAPLVSANGGDLVSTAASTYQWSLNGDAIVGATGQSFTPSENGNYSVTIGDANGCTSQSLPVYYGSVGVTDAAGGDVRAYPQPVRDVLRVDGLKGNTPARLLESGGRLVWRGTLAGDKAVLDMSTYAPGMYTLELGASEGHRSLVVVKE